MKKTYSMFQVHDYKGGELTPTINANSPGELLAELFENCDFSKATDENSLIIALQDFINEDDFQSTYAGGDTTFCGSIYEISGNIMKEVDVGDYINEIASYIIKTWNIFNKTII